MTLAVKIWPEWNSNLQPIQTSSITTLPVNYGSSIFTLTRHLLIIWVITLVSRYNKISLNIAQSNPCSKISQGVRSMQPCSEITYTEEGTKMVAKYIYIYISQLVWSVEIRNHNYWNLQISRYTVFHVSLCFMSY